jgi:hypothetical protein
MSHVVTDIFLFRFAGSLRASGFDGAAAAPADVAALAPAAAVNFS